MLTVKVKNALFKKLERISGAIAKKRIRVLMADNENEVGYTDAQRNIYLNPDHELLSALNDGERLKFVKGVWVHEMMHQLLTDFSIVGVLRRPNIVENRVNHTIFNIVEDARIENFAPLYIGGIYTEDTFDKNGKMASMSDLTFSKRVIYKQSPALDALNEDGTPMFSPYAQVVNAMISYGDCGIIKGKFLDKSAAEIFKELLPIYDSIIKEKETRTVLKKTLEIVEITRPLWEKDKEAVDKMQEMLDKMGKSNNSAYNKPLDRNPPDAHSESSASKSRKKTKEKMTAKEFEEAVEDDEVSNDGDGTEIEIEDPENISEETLKKLSKLAEENKKPDEDEESEGSGNSDDDEDDSVGDDNEDESYGSDDSFENTDEYDEDESDYEGSDVDSEEGTDSMDGEESDSDDNYDAESEKDEEFNSDDETSNSSGISIVVDGDEGTTKSKSSEDDDSSDSENPEGETDGNDSVNELGHTTESGNRPEITGDGDIEESEEVEDFEDMDDYVVPQNEIEDLFAELDKFIKNEENEENSLDDGEFVPVVVDIKSRYFKTASVINRNVHVENDTFDGLQCECSGDDIAVKSSYDNYEMVVSSLRPYINNATKQFQRIFRSKNDEKVHKTSGRININRAYSGTVSSRVFDKLKEGRKASNVAICLLVDESGSMSCENRYIYSKLTSIGIAEMCEELNIPLYVMGFTADEESKVTRRQYDAVHLHYIKWKNNKRTRLNLLAINARSNNFDGYSIRSATEILKKRPEDHKILIVISDGTPACYRYSTLTGIADAKLAVKEANKSCVCLGVAIGNNDRLQAQLKEIYGSNFLSVRDVSTLFQNISAKLKRMIKEDF